MMIDLIIKGSGAEMNSSEWKKPAITAQVIEQQRIKNIRTNSAILHNLSKPVHRDNLFLLGMDWQHNLDLLNIATPSLEKKAIDDQLKMMRSSCKEPPVRHAPTTFFTPKKKRDRKN
ncbi:hypothetical protein V8B55DRAFT_1538893 [Mucor lusitanicus]